MVGAPVLVVSSPTDVHALAVRRRLDRRGVPSRILDLSALPARASLSIRFARGRAPIPVLREEEHADLQLGEVRAVWWRRPRPIAVPSIAAPDHRRFAEREWRDATLGLWRVLPTRWVNDPVATDLAAVKPWQLSVAQEMGLPIPRTLVTSDLEAARAFLSSEGRAVRKTLHSEPGLWKPTQRVGPAEWRELEALGESPVLLQEHVPGVDLRVTVVGRRLFPVEIDARRSAAPDDCRVDLEGSTVRPALLPMEVARRILRMTRRLGLVYAAFDLRRRRNGEHVFLEVNPAGQWLGFELASGLPITDAVARLLASKARASADGAPSGARRTGGPRRHEGARSRLNPPGR